MELTAEQRRRLQRHTAPHELATTVGVFNLVATVVTVFRFPQHFWLWHLVKTCVLIPWRFVRFRRIRKTLYLLDWCYVVTHLCNVGALLGNAEQLSAQALRLCCGRAREGEASEASCSRPSSTCSCLCRCC